MDIHYIYDANIDKNCLCQGDILKRSPELIEELSTIHPHYATQLNYKYFMVLTQSCDLVRRNGQEPAAPYITIAAVRPIEDVLLKEARKLQEWWQQPLQIIDTKTFATLSLFTESLLNNNVPNYFYLHEELSLDITTRCCAFLRLSIALRKEHYDKCLAAKTAQIKDVFRAKLGWLVGNIYSRIGTEDWDDHYKGQDHSRKFGSKILGELFVNVDKEKMDKGIIELNKKKPLKEYSPDEIFDYIKTYKIISRHKQVNDIIMELFHDKIKIISPVRSILVQSFRKEDGKLICKLREILKCKDESDSEDIEQAILNAVQSSVDQILNEENYPNKDRFIQRIVTTVMQDARIRSLL